MNDLVVNNQLPTTIIDNQCSDTASAVSKRALDPIEQVIVVNDRQPLLYIPSLSHADNAAVVTEVQDAILLEHRPEHALHIHAWLGVGIERAFLLKLLGEEIHSEVAVLTGLCTGADANHFAGTALQDD